MGEELCSLKWQTDRPMIDCVTYKVEYAPGNAEPQLGQNSIAKLPIKTTYQTTIHQETPASIEFQFHHW